MAEQILFAVKKAVVAGQLRPGDKFPSVRALSQELRVNPNTAHKVVAALVAEGVLVTTPAVGSIVAERAMGDRQEKADLLGAELARTPAAQPWLHPARPGPRLGIVIPYRNRQLHLAKLLPHLISFFQRDLRNSHIQPLIVVSEQADDGKFNRGFCCNLGFAALRDHCDYICFHDVDYLPMWADYSASAFPSRIVWWGHHMRPLKADPANQYWLKGSRTGLGAVSVMDKAQYQAVNGYSNAYRGWGFEDTDLVARFALKGLPVQQRDGTFEPLDHDNAGMLAPGQLSPEWVANEARFKHQSAVYQQTGGMPEGLNSLAWHSLAFMFERWAGLDESEAGIICRIRAQQPG